jgi:hypothetical protein
MDKWAERETSWSIWCQLGQDLDRYLANLVDYDQSNLGRPNPKFQTFQQHSSSSYNGQNNVENLKVLKDGDQNDLAIFRALRESLIREATYNLLLQLESWPIFKSRENYSPNAQDKQEKGVSTQQGQLQKWFKEDLLVLPLYSQTLLVENNWDIDRFTGVIKSKLSLCSSFESFWLHFHSIYKSIRVVCQHLTAVKEFQGYCT